MKFILLIMFVSMLVDTLLFTMLTRALLVELAIAGDQVMKRFAGKSAPEQQYL